MEAPCLGVRPGIERADDLAAAVGVGARRLDGAAVADVSLGAVAHQAPLVVELVRPQLLALGALPVIVLLVVGEARGPVAQRAPVRVRREPLDRGRRREQEDGVAAREDRLRAHVSLAAVASSALSASTPAGAATSVKRMSSGSSSVTRVTVWRIPR